MGRWWTGYTSISAGMPGIAHSPGEPWLFAAAWRLQPSYGYGLWKAKRPSEKMCSIAAYGGAGCEYQMGMGHERFDDDLGAWASNSRFSELNPRRFYERWTQLMTAESWAEVPGSAVPSPRDCVGGGRPA